MTGMRSRLPLYIGGFMGPFGTIVIIPMFPELRDEFDATSSQVSLAYSLYLIPFAALLLVSGTLGERWGRRRTVRGTYLLYAAASLVAALAPNLEIFVAARAAQGVANAFITPLLVAGLAELVPAERLGREVGIYSSFQALGGGLGPVLGGIAADTVWQLAFWGTLVISLVLALFPPQGESRLGTSTRPQLRPLLTPRMVMLGVAFFFAAAGPIGIGVLVGVAARDVLELSGKVAGLVLFAGAMTAMLLGPVWGRLLDRHGARRVGMIAIGAATLCAGLPSLLTDTLAFGVLWAATSGLIALTVVVFQSLGASLLPDNRGGALSFLLSFRFLGHAVGPLVFIPVLERSVETAFFASAALGIITFLLVGGALSARQRVDVR